jgi:hypothetical protein
MDLITVLLLALISVGAALTFALRLFSWNQIVGSHWLAGIIFTVLLFLIFSGTLTGMLVAATGGLLFSLILSAGRYAQTLHRRANARRWQRAGG